MLQQHSFHIPLNFQASAGFALCPQPKCGSLGFQGMPWEAGGRRRRSGEPRKAPQGCQHHTSTSQTSRYPRCSVTPVNCPTVTMVVGRQQLLMDSLVLIHVKHISKYSPLFSCFCFLQEPHFCHNIKASNITLRVSIYLHFLW